VLNVIERDGYLASADDALRSASLTISAFWTRNRRVDSRATTRNITPRSSLKVQSSAGEYGSVSMNLGGLGI
jgi:hypothetical protein